MASTESAFAAVTSEGTVVAWGSSSKGGGTDITDDVTAPESESGKVVVVASTAHAFAALKKDGSVSVWGFDVRTAMLCIAAHVLLLFAVPRALSLIATTFFFFFFLCFFSPVYTRYFHAEHAWHIFSFDGCVLMIKAVWRKAR